MSTEVKPMKKRGRPRKQPAASPRPSTWQDRLRLSAGDVLRALPLTTKGTLGQHDTDHHEVIGADGQLVGTVEYSTSVSLKPPFLTRYWLVQKDIGGNVLVHTRW